MNLDAILAAPKDTSLRLAYADSLDSIGQIELAEFIRIQCNISDLNKRFVKLPRHSSFSGISIDAKINDLRARESELLWNYADKLTNLPFDDIGAVYNGVGGSQLMRMNGCEFVVQFCRGFIEIITCDCMSFLKNVDSICELTPLRKVILSDRPNIAARCTVEGGCWYGWANAESPTMSYSPSSEIADHTDSCGVVWHTSVIKRILAVDFPNLEFKLSAKF